MCQRETDAYGEDGMPAFSMIDHGEAYTSTARRYETLLACVVREAHERSMKSHDCQI
jgi:hypothetical protein